MASVVLLHQVGPLLTKSIEFQRSFHMSHGHVDLLWCVPYVRVRGNMTFPSL